MNLAFQGTDPYVLSASSMRYLPYLSEYAKTALVGRRRGVLPRVAAMLPGRSVGGARLAELDFLGQPQRASSISCHSTSHHALICAPAFHKHAPDCLDWHSKSVTVYCERLLGTTTPTTVLH